VDSDYIFSSILNLLPLVVVLVGGVIVLVIRGATLPGRAKALAFAALGVEVIYLFARIGYAIALPQLLKADAYNVVVIDVINAVEELISWVGFALLIVAVLAGRSTPGPGRAPAGPYPQGAVPRQPADSASAPHPYPYPPQPPHQS
jgi:hypothetical protein